MAVKGAVNVKNVGSAATKNLMITDVVQANVGNGFVDVASIAVDTSKKPVLAAGEEFSYPFTVYFKHVDGATYQNIERVSISNLVDRTGQSMAAEAVMSVKATSAPLQANGQDANATLTDVWTAPYGWVTSPSTVGPWTLTDTQTVSYTMKVTNVFASFFQEVALTNTATLTESDSGDTEMASETVKLSTNFEPGIKIVKTAPDCVKRGDMITYTFTVYNIGDSFLNNVTVLDPMFPDSLNYYIGTMAAGSDVTFTAQYQTDANTPAMLVNTATVYGMFSCVPLSNTSTATVNVVNPSISIEKTGPECVGAGATITWSFNITNTGENQLNNVLFSDEVLGVLNENLGSLAPGASLVFTRTSTAPMSGSVENEASVTATASCGLTVEDSDDATVSVVNPSMTFQKGGPDCVRLGDSITWTFSILNTGDVTLTNLMLVDPPVGVTVPMASLAPGEYWNFTYVTTPAASGAAYNFAYVTADAPCGAQLNVTDDHSVLVINPAIEIVKGGPNSEVGAGSEIVWTFSIKNIGDAPLINVIFDDPLLVVSKTYTDNGGVLAVGAYWNFTLNSVAPNEPGTVTNVATVTASSQCGDVSDISDSSIFVVEIVLNSPGIEIIKSAPPCAQVGTPIVWQFTVNNIGNINLTNVLFSDALLGITNKALPDLVVGASYSWTQTSNAPLSSGTVTNVGSVVASSDFGDVSDSSDAVSVSVVNPKISIEKGGPDSVEPGANIVWTFSIMNTGDTPLSNVVFNDPPVGVTLTYTDNGGVLAVGAKWEFTYTTVAPESGDVDNYAYVTALGSCGIQVRDDDDHTVQVESPCDCDCLLVTKTGSTQAVPGGMMVWEYSIYNCAYPNDYPCMTNFWLHDEITLGDGTVFAIFDSYSGELIPCAVGTPMVPWTLAPGQWFNFTVEWQVPISWTYCEYGEWMNNTFKAQACCAGGFARGEASWSTHILDSASIDIQKYANVDQAAPGDTIQYTLVITNTGMSKLCALKVWEQMAGGQKVMIDLGCDLDPCESVTYTFEWTVPSYWNFCDDPSMVKNYAGACAYSCETGKWVQDEDSFDVEIIYPPQIEIIKTANVTMAYANPLYGNNEITYNLTVRNIGPYPITCVNIVDEDLNIDEMICCLMPCRLPCDVADPADVRSIDNGGDGCDCASCQGGMKNVWYKEIKTTVPADWAWCDDGDYLDNTATASGYACGIPVSDSSTVSILIKDEYHLEIEKSAPEVVYQGQTITYEILVRNAGSKVLSYIDVYDDVDSDQVIDFQTTIECLNPCQEVLLTFDYTVPMECCVENYQLWNFVWATAYVRTIEVYADDMMYSTVMCPCSLDIVIEAQDSALPGETVEFTVTVTNDGTKTIVQMDVWAMLMSTVCHNGESYKLGCIVYLNPGESTEFSFSYTVPTCEQCCQSGYWLSYSAMVEGQCGCSGCSEMKIVDSDEGSVRIVPCCAIDVEITGEDCAEPGDTVIFTITVTNPGVTAVCCVSVESKAIGFYQELDGLMPGETRSWEWSFTIPADWNHCDDKDLLFVEVSAKALCCECSFCEKEVWANDKDSMSVDIYDPITLIVDKIYLGTVMPTDDKSAGCDPGVDSRPRPGDTVFYKIVVMNKGCLPLSCIHVTDSRYGTVTCIPCLAPCASWETIISITIPSDWNWCDNGEIFDNTVYAAGYACDVAVSAQDTESIMVNVDHIVQVYKSGPSEVSPGETFSYQISVYNAGKQPLCCLKVSDYISTGLVSRSVGNMLDYREIDCLDPCEWYNYTVEYTVPEDWTCMDGEWLYNEVRVDGKACWPCENMQDMAWTMTKIVDIQPAIEVEKNVYYKQNGKMIEFAVPGQTVWYKFTITNPNCKALGCIEVEDEMLGFYEIIPCMEPFETVTIWVPHTIPADWSNCDSGDSFENMVEVSAWACTKRVSDSDSMSLMIWNPMDLRISKTADKTEVMPGETITYTITVWNAGSKMLSNVMIVDEMLNFCETIECLMPCDSETYTETYTVPEDWTYCRDGEWVNNTAVAWAIGYVGGFKHVGVDIVSDDASVKVVGIDESIRVSKELVMVNGNSFVANGAMPEVNPGDKLIWMVTVRNTGKLALSCINITDVMISCQGDEWVLYDESLICCLAPCTSMEIPIEFVVPEECCGDFMLTNTVTATAWAEDVFVSWSDTERVMVQGDCDIEITKTPLKDWYWSDQEIGWSITVTNTGALKLFCVNVTDNLLPGGYWYVGDLAAGASKTVKVYDKSMSVPCSESITMVYNDAAVTAQCSLCGENDDCCDLYREVRGAVEVRPVFDLDVSIETYWNGDCDDVRFAEMCCPEPGDVIYIGVTVTNVGRYAINGFELTDILMNVHEVNVSKLSPGESAYYEFPYTIPSDWTFCDDGKYLEDCFTAMACELCPVVGRVIIMDSDCFRLEVCGPQLLMTKMAYVDGELVTEVWPGDVVTYEITVKNVGEHSVSFIHLVDVIWFDGMPIEFMSDMICCLESCDEFVWTFEYTVPEWFCIYGDYLYDKVIAWGLVNDIECGKKVLDGYNPWIELACAENKLYVHNEFNLQITKTNNFGLQCAKPGDWIEYTVIVMNAGTVAITNVYVDDDLIGLHTRIDCLYPCQPVTLTGKYQVPADWSACDDGPVVVNTVTATGWQCGFSQTVSYSNYVYVNDACDVRIDIDYPQTAQSGETVTVTITVSNEGSSMAFGLKVVDTRLGLNEMIWCLEPCESVTFTKTVVIPDCDGVTHKVNGVVNIVGCCCECWDCEWLPEGVLSDSQEPCCCVHEEASWEIMIVCGCC